MKKVLGIFVLIVLGSVGLFFVFRTKPVSHQAFAENKSVVLPIEKLKNRSFTYTKSFIGSVQAVQSVAVRPYLSGYLKEVRVRSGQEVIKNEILFLLDDRIPLANLNQAREVVSQTYAARANAENFYQRMKKTDSQAISSTDLEQAKTEFEAADATYQKALAAQNQAQTLYDYTVIRAPISGWVGNITATVGEYLSPESKTLGKIVGFSPVRLVFSVPVSACNADFSDNKAVLQVVSAGGNHLEFKKFQVFRDNQVNKSTDAIAFFTDVDNPEKVLIPGAYAEVNFLYPMTGILVDKNRITLTSGGAEAYVLVNGVVEKRTVQIGAPIGNQYWIKAGLTEGDNLITVPVASHQIGQAAEGVGQ